APYSTPSIAHDCSPAGRGLAAWLRQSLYPDDLPAGSPVQASGICNRAGILFLPPCGKPLSLICRSFLKPSTVAASPWLRIVQYLSPGSGCIGRHRGLSKECIVRVLVTALPYLFAISGLAAAPPPETLSPDAFARTASFITSTGRPLERALF